MLLRVVGHRVLPVHMDLSVILHWVPRWDVSARLLVWCGKGSLEKVLGGTWLGGGESGRGMLLGLVLVVLCTEDMGSAQER